MPVTLSLAPTRRCPSTPAAMLQVRTWQSLRVSARTCVSSCQSARRLPEEPNECKHLSVCNFRKTRARSTTIMSQHNSFVDESILQELAIPLPSEDVGTRPEPEADDPDDRYADHNSEVCAAVAKSQRATKEFSHEEIAPDPEAGRLYQMLMQSKPQPADITPNLASDPELIGDPEIVRSWAQRVGGERPSSESPIPHYEEDDAGEVSGNGNDEKDGPEPKITILTGPSPWKPSTVAPRPVSSRLGIRDKQTVPTSHSIGHFNLGAQAQSADPSMGRRRTPLASSVSSGLGQQTDRGHKGKGPEIAPIDSVSQVVAMNDMRELVKSLQEQVKSLASIVESSQKQVEELLKSNKALVASVNKQMEGFNRRLDTLSGGMPSRPSRAPLVQAVTTSVSSSPATISQPSGSVLARRAREG
uniref:Uncharacterized protein n=1 Tax=Rhizoctonia cerealis phyllomonavirus TaxID=3068671 RepID=A0AA51BST6_9MONO|nr:MAG: hypothetical protein [Rhizoctonia cerealis phyllomonavirus]